MPRSFRESQVIFGRSGAAAMASVCAGLRAAKAEARTETVEFLHPPRADLEKAEVLGADVLQFQLADVDAVRGRGHHPRGKPHRPACGSRFR